MNDDIVPLPESDPPDDLWEAPYDLRQFVEWQSFYYSLHPLDESQNHLLISSVEQIWLTDNMMSVYLHTPEPDEMFESSLLKWGLIQALFVQQDAIRYFAKVLEVEIPEFRDIPELLNIRANLRHRYVGHPVVNERPRKGKKGKSQMTDFVISAKSDKPKHAVFILIDDKSGGVQEFDLVQVIATQRREINAILEHIRSQVMNREESTRKELRAEDPLKAIRNSTIEYLVGKSLPGHDTLQRWRCTELLREVQAISDAFIATGKTRRGIDSELELWIYAVEQVCRFYESNDRHLNERDVAVYLEFVRAQYSVFKRYAEEIQSEIDQSPAL